MEHPKMITWTEGEIIEFNRLYGKVIARTEAEAELARRDAAAVEPVGVIRENPDDIGLIAEFEMMPPLGSKLYTAAPPAVLPPEWEGTEHNEYAAGKQDGWNECLEEALKLGAQPQMVVELPAVRKSDDVAYGGAGAFTMGYSGGFNECLAIVTSAIDAANVKWEVKK